MNKKIKYIFGMMIMGFVACGGSNDVTSPGKGPGFSSTLTAAELWSAITWDPYVPYELKVHGETISGSANCNRGGSATTEFTVSENVKNLDVTYQECGNLVDEFYGFSAELSRNGAAKMAAHQTGTGGSFKGTYSYENHVSYSGDIGFAEDCNYTIEITSDTELNSETYKFSGECTYTDSKGKVLRINGDEMSQVAFGS